MQDISTQDNTKNWLASGLRSFLFLVGFEMRAQAVDNVVFVSFLHLFLYFFQGEMHDVVMVHFQGRYGVTEAQPHPVQKIDFVRRQIGRVRPEDLVNLVPVGHVNFQVELRPLVAELFPGVADQPGLLFGALVRGMAQDDGAGLERGRRAQDAVGEIVGGDDRQANGFTAFFRKGERLRKELLLDAAEELFGLKFVFSGGRAAQQAHVKHDDVAAAGFDAIEHVAQLIEGVNIADRHEDVARPRADGLGGQLAFHLQMKLVHFHVLDVAAGVMREFFRNGEDDEEHHGEGHAGDGCVFLGEKVYDGNAEQRQGDQAEAERNFHAKNREVQRHAVLAIARMRVAQDQHRQALHPETPDHPKGLEVREKGYITTADSNGDDMT